jgi:glutamate--cysteine ligase
MQLQTDGYLSLIRNFFSRAWVLLYLLGASPTVCASFVQGNRNHHLKPMGDDHHSYYLPYATSLRMGDLGYTSNAQADLNVCYNDLDQYISTLRNAILTPHQAYQDFTFMDNGEPAQLNDSLLQIENEYYSPIRPKRVTESGEAPIAALGRNGIEYIEVRCVDINPFIPYGIDADTMRLLDLFLMSCLIDDSPLCDEAGQKRNEINLQRMINRGREPDLTLLSASGIETPMQLLAQPVLERMAEIAEWFTSEDSADEYRRVAAEAGQKFADPDRTLSARMLREMAESGLSYSQLALRYSRQWHAQHLSDPLSEAASTRLKSEAEQSIHRQHAIESQNSEAFEDYLSSFYQQYQSSDA